MTNDVTSRGDEPPAKPDPSSSRWKSFLLFSLAATVLFAATSTYAVVQTSRMEHIKLELGQAENEAAAMRAEIAELLAAKGRQVHLSEQLESCRSSVSDLREAHELYRDRGRRAGIEPPPPSGRALSARIEELKELCQAEDSEFEACRLIGDAFREPEQMRTRCTDGDSAACGITKAFEEMADRQRQADQRARALAWYQRGCPGVQSTQDSRVRSPASCEAAAHVLVRVHKDAEAKTYFERGCVTGSASACLQLGVSLGSAEERSLPRAYFLAACIGGDAAGCHYLAHEFFTRVKDRSQRDRPTRRFYLERACRLGYRQSCQDLASAEPRRRRNPD